MSRVFFKSMKNAKKTAGGFTLLELLIVLMLISIIIAIVSVSLASVANSTGLESDARSIAATLRSARALATIEGRRENVLIDMDSRRFGIEDRKFRYLRRGVNIEVVDDNGEEIQSGIYKMSFSPSGALDGGTVIIWNRKKQLRIEPDPVTGSTVPE